MKLSEAIRLGSMLKPQAFNGVANRPKSCAMTAAAEAAGINPYTTFAYYQEWPWLMDRLDCPACSMGKDLKGGQIITLHLNDSHRWTRERIADWVATIEPADVPAVEPVEALEAAC